MDPQVVEVLQELLAWGVSLLILLPYLLGED
jgi:hypothetical protein